MHVYLTFALLAMSFALLLALLVATCWRVIHRRDWRNLAVPIAVLLASSGIVALAAFEMTTAFQNLLSTATISDELTRLTGRYSSLVTVTQARTTYYRAIRFELSDFLIGAAIMLMSSRMIFRSHGEREGSH